jgi:signal transduction histidine kinase
VYVERAGEGVDRLARLISRLSEATRLESMLESAERESFDLAKLVAGCVEGYRAAYAPRLFEITRPEGPLVIRGVPDAVAQLVDKLAENAHDFAPAGTPIRFAVGPRPGGGAILSVENAGPALPEAARARLFDSMVSLRPPEGGGGAGHLGLGLYIVRIVAEFHGGTVRAANLPGDSGVRFEVELP